MSRFIQLFLDAPFAVFAATAVLFALRLRCRWWGRLLAIAGLAFSCSIFLAFGRFGHSNVLPELPEGLIWFWNWAYGGAMALAVLSAVFVFRFPRKGLVLPLVAWTLSAWGLWNAVRLPDVRELEFAFPDLPRDLDGYRIVQISDLHASSALRAWRTRAIVERANALDADLVCLTGDFGDGNAEKYHETVAPLADLRAKDGVWAVTGNHEWFRTGWWPWYAKCGLKFLENACVFPRKGLALGGVNDSYCRTPCLKIPAERHPDVGKAFAAATNGEFRILMQHRPQEMRENATRRGVRLQLSGHTHGGVMPILSAVVGRRNGGFVRGVYREGDAILYVNPGCGQATIFLTRLFNPSEITLITLRRRQPPVAE